MVTAQDLEQGTYYESSREGRLEIRWLAVPHAERALSKLIEEHGDDVLVTPLGRALADRAGRAGEPTEVHAIDGRSRMIRGEKGRFTGSYVPKTGRKV